MVRKVPRHVPRCVCRECVAARSRTDGLTHMAELMSNSLDRTAGMSGGIGMELFGFARVRSAANRSARVMTRNVLRIALLALAIGLPAVTSGVEASSPARCDVSPQPCVSFWQRDVLLAGEGWCVVEFGFDGVGLASPVAPVDLSIE